MTNRPRRSVHLVGSVPLANAADVFRMVTDTLGADTRRLPDGETGPRRNWINFQYALLTQHPQLEFAGPPIDPATVVEEHGGAGGDYAPPTPLRLRAGVAPSELRIENLGYAAAALESYALFAELKRRGKIRRDVRFLLALPTPLAPIALFVVPAHMFDVLPAYSAALLAEIKTILAAVPPEELALQWDVAVEFGLWEGLFPPPPGAWKPALLAQLAALGNAIPSPVELGYHLCYGDRGHRHFFEPTDLGNLVEVANGIAARLERPLQWVHMPVPRARNDREYFAPLARLALPTSAELVLGLVHHTDGVVGTRARIAAAEHFRRDFGIAAECGLGRRDPATIEAFLRMHAEVAGV